GQPVLAERAQPAALITRSLTGDPRLSGTGQWHCPGRFFVAWPPVRRRGGTKAPPRAAVTKNKARRGANRRQQPGGTVLATAFRIVPSSTRANPSTRSRRQQWHRSQAQASVPASTCTRW